MLENIDQVPWETLNHKYGTATDLPDLFRRLEQKEDNVLKKIEERIFFNEEIFTATPYALRFLFEFSAHNPDVNLLIARCCRSSIWTLPNTPERRLSERIIDELDHVLSALFLLLDTNNTSIISSIGAILFYGSDRENIAETLIHFLEKRIDLNETARVVLSLASHSAPGISILDLNPDEEKTETGLEAFARRLAQSSTGLQERDRQRLLDDIYDTKKVERLIVLLREKLQDALGSFGELLLMASSDTRGRFVLPFLSFFEDKIESEQAWELALVLLHMAFEKYDPSIGLAPEQRAVLNAFYRADTLWNTVDFAKEVSRHIAFSIENPSELQQFLRDSQRIVGLIITPNEAPLIRGFVEKMHRTEWLNAPWFLFKGDTSALEEQIKEENAYFDEHIMADASQIASLMISNIAFEINPLIDAFRFYPQLDANTLENICKDNGWEVYRAPAWSSSLTEMSYSEAFPKPESLDKGLLWRRLSLNIRREVELCVQYLSRSLWDEAALWHDQVKRSKTPIAPLMFAKYRDNLELTLSYWPYDRVKAKRTGIQSGERYLLMAIEDPSTRELTQIRIYFEPNLKTTLIILRKYQDMLAESKDFLQRFLQELILNVEHVALEFENGVVQTLSLQKYDA